jgi:hypothetical protein
MTPIEQLKKLVEETFGSMKSPDEIAQLCRDRQIQGFQGHFTSCPMVKLIREQVDFQVGFTMGKKLGSGSWSWVTYDRMVGFQSPFVCDEFSDNFDIGKYPDLIAFPKKEEATKES